MPTNLIANRSRPKPARTRPAERPAQQRLIRIKIGDRTIRARLLDTPTADRIWHALPLFAPAETWGDAIHCETVVRTGRDRTAKLHAAVGEIYYCAADERVIFAFGRTPISGPKEMRLPQPCNVWAVALDDLAVFRGTTPGDKISFERIDEAT